jgi:hypothetical protein
MKPIKIQARKINKYKLTVTPFEVRIKLKEESTDAIDELAIAYLKRVTYNREMLYCDQVWRGQMVERYREDGTPEYKIAMKTNGKNKLYFYA